MGKKCIKKQGEVQPAAEIPAARSQPSRNGLFNTQPRFQPQPQTRSQTRTQQTQPQPVNPQPKAIEFAPATFLLVSELVSELRIRNKLELAKFQRELEQEQDDYEAHVKAKMEDEEKFDEKRHFLYS